MTGLEPIEAAIAAGKPTLLIWAIAGDDLDDGHDGGTLLISQPRPLRELAALVAVGVSGAVDAPKFVAKMLPAEFRGEFVKLMADEMRRVKSPQSHSTMGLTIEKNPPEKGTE
jgi:hypothetical protein